MVTSSGNFNKKGDKVCKVTYELKGAEIDDEGVGHRGGCFRTS